MQLFVYVLIFVVLYLDYVAKTLGIHGLATAVAPEGLSAIALLLVAFHMGVRKQFHLDAKYVLFLLAMGAILLSGAIVNQLDPGAAIGGVRLYFKYLPIFLIPIVYRFTPDQLRNLLLFVLALLLLEMPLTVFQRFLQFGEGGSGDLIRGTMGTGSQLSILLVCAIAAAFSAYLKKRVATPVFAMIALMLFIPTTINETKGTIILLPIALALPFYFSGEKINPAKLVGVAAAGVAALVLYAGLYAYTQERYVGKNLSAVEFFTDPQSFLHYLAPRTAGMEVRDERYGRADRPWGAIETLAEEGPIMLLLGHGIGSTSEAPIDMFSGELVEEYAGDLTDSAAPWVLLETGLLGAIAWLVFLWMLFKDARSLSTKPDTYGVLGLAWTAVTAIIFASLFYKQIISVNGIMYLFWLFTGHVVSEVFLLRRRSGSLAPHVGSLPRAPTSSYG